MRSLGLCCFLHLPPFGGRPRWSVLALPAKNTLFLPLLSSLLSPSFSRFTQLRFCVSSARCSPLLFRVNPLQFFYLLSTLPRFSLSPNHFRFCPTLWGKLERVSLIVHTIGARDGTEEISTALESIKPSNIEPRDDITVLQLRRVAHRYL
jgi:hypothetical protein